MSQVEDYDIIFAGGGTTGCLTASRLADSNPSLRILVLEAGPHTLQDLAHIQPARFINHLLPDSKTVSFIPAKAEAQLLNRPVIVPCGHCIGGGSSVNFMMYTRASASDYDDWETKFDNPGWGSKDLIPLLKKVETYQVSGQQDLHGYSGPLKVSYGGPLTNIGKDFLEVGKQYDPNRGFTDDPNDLYHCDVYGRWQKWISIDGRRSDVAHNFIYDKPRDNLTITTGHLVKRVLFEGTNVTGVEFIQSPRVYPEASSEVFTARAKLVVLSAGTFGSPGILERSGIGAHDILDRIGVNQIVDLPGVGENYQDHPVIFSHYIASDESETIEGIVTNDKEETDKWSSQWLKDGSGLMASNGLDCGIKIRPTEQDLRNIGPSYQAKWRDVYLNAPDKPVMWIGPLAMAPGGKPAGPPYKKSFSMIYFMEHASSRGRVHIRSGDDPTVTADFETGFLTAPDDLALMKWGYKRSREYARRMACYRGEFSPEHPRIAQTSPNACRAGVLPVTADAPDLIYTEEEEKAIEEYTRTYVATAWHSLGTCSMKPRSQGGVVDPSLNVYGVHGLKVADLSIPPSNVAANTYSTALAIAEKAAIIIASELGISV